MSETKSRRFDVDFRKNGFNKDLCTKESLGINSHDDDASESRIRRNYSIEVQKND